MVKKSYRQLKLENESALLNILNLNFLLRSEKRLNVDVAKLKLKSSLNFVKQLNDFIKVKMYISRSVQRSNGSFRKNNKYLLDKMKEMFCAFILIKVVEKLIEKC